MNALYARAQYLDDRVHLVAADILRETKHLTIKMYRPPNAYNKRLVFAMLGDRVRLYPTRFTNKLMVAPLDNKRVEATKDSFVEAV